MSLDVSENLPDETRLALAYSGAKVRDALRIFFEFDLRLSRIVAGTTEPMLGQIRLAWWRDALQLPMKERPKGDAVLDGISTHWAGKEAALIELVYAWEQMLSEPPLKRSAAQAFAEGRAAPLRALSKECGFAEEDVSSVNNAGLKWALADAASHVAAQGEHDILVSVAQEFAIPGKIKSPLKGIAVLGALGLRALDLDGAPLMVGRGAALVALRAGLFGR